MRHTAPTVVRTRPVTDESLGDWTKYEIIPSINELRRAANYTSRELKAATTDGAGTYTSIWKSDVMRDTVAWRIQADIVGVSADMGVRCSHLIWGLFYKTGGVITLQGGAPTYVAQIESDAAVDATFAIDVANQKVTVAVRDNAVVPMTFEAIVDWREWPHP